MKPLEHLHRPLFYELPPGARSSKTGRGQVQYWFVFRLRGPDKEISLGDKKEFRAWKWMPMSELVADVVAFKRGVYEEVAKHVERVQSLESGAC